MIVEEKIEELRMEEVVAKVVERVEVVVAEESLMINEILHLLMVQRNGKLHESAS